MNRQYAFDDFTISQVAKALGKTSDGQKVAYILLQAPDLLFSLPSLQYAQRSENFNHVWNANTTFPGRKDIAGFMQVRYYL